MESSNGSFYESSEHGEKMFDSRKWKEMGAFLVKGLEIWVEKSINSRTNRKVNINLDSDEEGKEIE